MINADTAHFVNSINPWFNRGGDFAHGLGAGAFSFSNNDGRMASWISFRVVL